MAKKSFFERLTGTVRLDDSSHDEHLSIERSEDDDMLSELVEEDANVGQLAIDVYDNANDIIVKTMVAGVKPEDLDISITRDMVTIRGKREETTEAKEDDYFHKELYWGSFARTIILPEEIDVEESEAIEKHGLLILRLPKIDKARQNKLKVKSI